MLSTSRTSHQRIDPNLKLGKRGRYPSPTQDKAIDELITILSRMRQATTEAAYNLRRQRLHDLLKHL